MLYCKLQHKMERETTLVIFKHHIFLISKVKNKEESSVNISFETKEIFSQGQIIENREEWT